MGFIDVHENAFKMKVRDLSFRYRITTSVANVYRGNSQSRDAVEQTTSVASCPCSYSKMSDLLVIFGRGNFLPICVGFGQGRHHFFRLAARRHREYADGQQPAPHDFLTRKKHILYACLYSKGILLRSNVFRQ